MAPNQSDVVFLNDKKYRIVPESWQWNDVSDFAPRASTPGGLVYSELGLYQNIIQSDWTHGFGFQWHADDAGYLETQGNLDTRHSGIAMLMTKSTSSHTAAATRNGMIVFKSNVYTWGDDGVWRYSTANGWESVGLVFNRVDYDLPTIIDMGTAAVASPQTKSFTMPVKGNNRMLMVHVIMNTGRTVTGITFNGDAMTSANAMVGGASPYIHSWYLLNPDTVTGNIVVTYTGGTTTMMLYVQPFYYVHQATPFGTILTANGAATSSSLALTSAVGEVSVDIIAKIYGAADALTIGASQSNLGLYNQGTALTTQMSVEPGAATNTMSWTWTNSRVRSHIAIPVKPAADVSHKVNAMFANGTYLFILPDGARIQKSSSGGISAADWDNAGVNANALDYKWGLMHAGQQYFGQDGNSLVFFDSNDDLSQLHGLASDDTQEINVGAGGFPTLRAISFASRMLVFRRDGMWEVDSSGVAHLILNYYNEQSDDNFRGAAIANGYLYFPIRDRLLRWNGAGINNATPDPLTITFPYKTYGRFTNLISVMDWLYCTARTNETTYTESILCYDGVGWHKLADPITDGDGTISMMGYDPVNNRLWYHVTKAASETIYYIPFQNQSEFPYADFATTGTHRLISSRYDMGFRRIDKSMPWLLLEASNLTATRYIKVLYSLDGGDWVDWKTIREDGTTLLSEPGDARTREFEYLQIAIDFVTATATESPILEGFVPLFLMRPDESYGYTFSVIVESSLEIEGEADSRTSNDIVKELKGFRHSKKPVRLQGPYGEELWGYVTSVQGQVGGVGEYGEGERTDLKQVVRVNFIETEDLTD